MKYPFKIKFNEPEWQIICDRLEMPDCIAQALTDDMEDGEELYREVYTTAEAMWSAGPEVVITNETELSVLTDCVDGSTMPPKINDQIEEGYPEERNAARKLKRYFKTIEAKFDKAGIKGVKFTKF